MTRNLACGSILSALAIAGCSGPRACAERGPTQAVPQDHAHRAESAPALNPSPFPQCFTQIEAEMDIRTRFGTSGDDVRCAIAYKSPNIIKLRTPAKDIDLGPEGQFERIHGRDKRQLDPVDDEDLLVTASQALLACRCVERFAALGSLEPVEAANFPFGWLQLSDSIHERLLDTSWQAVVDRSASSDSVSRRLSRDGYALSYALLGSSPSGQLEAILAVGSVPIGGIASPLDTPILLLLSYDESDRPLRQLEMHFPQFNTDGTILFSSRSSVDVTFLELSFK